MRVLILFVALCIRVMSIAQEINNHSPLFDVRDSSFTRISYDNDLFVGTDRYYTQGIGVDVFSHRLRNNSLNVILVGFKKSNRDRFGIDFRTHGCTPTSILSDSVLIGDRPYAGVFSFGMIRSSQLESRLRLTSKFELGMIGPAALGEETQTGIHKLTGDDLPQGWQHQIKNAPIVNYMMRLDVETRFAIPALFHSSVFGQSKIGTFQTNVSTGFEFGLGRLNKPSSLVNHRYSFFLYSQTSVTLVGYDASLMGGIINRDGYYLQYSQINPLVLRQVVGLNVSIPHVSFGFQFVFATREIKEGLPHGWGGVRLTFY